MTDGGRSAGKRATRREGAGVVLFCLALAFAVYAVNLDDGFLGDDFDLIGSFYGKPLSYFARLICFNESGDVWSAWGLDPALGEGYLRPLKIWLLKLDFTLWGTSAPGYRVTSTLLFALVLWLVFKLLRELLPVRRELAVLGTVLVAVHPVFAQIVPFITAREELLATAGVLGALLGLIAIRRRGASSLGFLLCLALGLLSKESAIIAVPLALGWELVHRGERSASGAAQRTPRPSTWRLFLPVGLLLALYVLLRWIAFGNVVGGEGAPTLYGSGAAFLAFHERFLRSLVEPDLLAGAAWPPLAPLLGLACAVALVAGLLTCWRRPDPAARRDLLFFGPVWYLVCSALLYGTYFSHRHHAPSLIGLVLFAMLVLAQLTQGVSRRARLVLAVSGCLLAGALFLPPTWTTARRFDVASGVVEAVRARIEDATRELPSGSRIRLEGVPQLAEPPYYFGWGLMSALKRPFSASDLAARCTVIDERNLHLTRVKQTIPESFDIVLRFDADALAPR